MRGIDFSRPLGAAPPLLLALLVAKLWWTGTLGYYVNARTIPIVVGGGVVCGLVGVAGLWSALRAPSGPPLSWRAPLLAATLLLGVVLPPRPLSAASGQAGSLGALQLAAHLAPGDAQDRFANWVGTLYSHPDPSWWAGRPVSLIGFVASQPDLPPRSFIVGRYLVTCCVVDAVLLGFPAQITAGPLPPAGRWVQVRGVFGRQGWRDSGGTRYPLIQSAQVTPAAIPQSPYLSP